MGRRLGLDEGGELTAHVKSIYLLLGLIMLALPAPAQSSGDWLQIGKVPYSPLVVLTNGPGRVFPFENGEMLEVGRGYTLTASPDRGCAFKGWNRVNVFTFTEYTFDESGNLVATTNTIVSPTPQIILNPVLEFKMEPEFVLYDVPGTRTITQSIGWQANFVAAGGSHGGRN